MFIDTHAHVNFNAFKKDAPEVISRALAENTWMILIGTNHKTSRQALDYANRYEQGVYASVGLHPIHLSKVLAEEENFKFKARGEEFNLDAYDKLARFEKVVAIGEIGLDHYHIDRTGDVDAAKKQQKEVFIKQLRLARTLDKPVIIHCRDAHDDMVAVISKFRKENKQLFGENKPWGVVHCFTGDEDLAWKYFGLDLLISFTGVITFSNEWDDFIRKLSLDKFMIETDCPYMAPEPYRGKRNEPMHVKYIAEKIAEVKNLSLEKVADITTKNARKFFNI